MYMQMNSLEFGIGAFYFSSINQKVFIKKSINDGGVVDL